jgi:uridylate kinase
VVAAGGTGNPFFTTDTAAILRAVELQCDGMMKATQVDGVYSADPKTDPEAERFETITYDDVLSRGLTVMDAAAIALARDNAMPVSVFKLDADGVSIRDAWHGRRPMTRVKA